MKRFSRLIYSNKIFCLFLMIVQLCIFLVTGLWLSDYSKYVYACMIVLSAILIIHEINRDEEPGFKITWIMLIAIIPVFGALLYMFLHYNRKSAKIKLKSNEIARIVKPHNIQNPEVDIELKNYPDESGVSKFLYDKCECPTYLNSSVKYYPLGDNMFVDLIDELEKAEKFIFIEVFIINPKGRMWPEILNVLQKKVEQGVEVRLMYDGMGCLNFLPEGYADIMNELGIKCRVFAPIVPLFSTYQNNRDHRKIIVIDGRVAFTGGVNFSDEYINETMRFGHWKDNAIMVSGEAVSGFTSMFLKMWNVSADEIENDEYEKYISATKKYKVSSNKGLIIPFMDTPLENVHSGEKMYINNLNMAKKYVHIMTPYLVIGSSMMDALKFAVSRGIDVKIILPHIPDKPYAFWLAGTYYMELITAGVEIYEYIPGFVHAKMSISDGKRAIIGTINHDYRSLYLHYECAAYLVDVPEISDMESDFEKTLKYCQKISIEDYKNKNIFTRLAGRIIKLLAPLL